MTKTYYSGDWYMTISNEPPMTNDGKIYCQFDQIKYKHSFWGCPVNQFGTVGEVLSVLQSWKKIDDKPEFANIKKLNVDVIKMENNFINILKTFHVVH